MPKYYFDTIVGGPDRDGGDIELPDDATARIHAIRFVGAILTGHPTDFSDAGVLRLEVRNEQRELLFMITTFLTHDPERRAVGTSR